MIDVILLATFSTLAAIAFGYLLGRAHQAHIYEQELDSDWWRR